MLTRLKVRGFKNLVDIDIRFGPFTCIAGANGVGKSNLFDAIRFLSALTSMPLKEAARIVRDNPRAEVRNLFHRVGDWHAESMFFEAEMIIPKSGEDDFGLAEASMTFVRYTLELGYKEDGDSLEILKESLVHINKGEAPQHLLFPHSKSWRDSVITGRLTSPLISVTQSSSGETLIQLHQNAGGKGGGRPMPVPARTLRRTLINQANSSEHKTAVVARNEMKSWIFLQLEPSALRESDKISESGVITSITPIGNHMPSVLYKISKTYPNVFENISLRLSQLVKELRKVGIKYEESNDSITLWAAGPDGTQHAARSLSDGTLRFLALSILEENPNFKGVLCLEEPENGIHPERIPAMLSLLQDISVDANQPVNNDNLLRQVIINTHSPVVAATVPKDSLIGAELVPGIIQGKRFYHLSLSCLPQNWRLRNNSSLSTINRGDLLRYLRPWDQEYLEPDAVGQIAWEAGI